MKKLWFTRSKEKFLKDIDKCLEHLSSLLALMVQVRFRNVYDRDKVIKYFRHSKYNVIPRLTDRLSGEGVFKI